MTYLQMPQLQSDLFNLSYNLDFKLYVSINTAFCNIEMRRKESLNALMNYFNIGNIGSLRINNELF